MLSCGPDVAAGGDAIANALRTVRWEQWRRWAIAACDNCSTLAFTVSDPLHGRTAGVATVRGGRARRFSHGLITAGTIAKNFRMFFAA